MCWVLGCFEDELEPLYWQRSYRELTARLKLKIGEFTVSHLQQAYGVAQVAAMVFGGKKDEVVLTDVDAINRAMGGR